MVGTSRKSFIGKITGKKVGSRLFGTAATVALRTGYGLGYAGVSVALACLVFSRKDLR